jgi:hypothetical protein
LRQGINGCFLRCFIVISFIENMKKRMRAVGPQPHWIQAKVGSESLKLELTSGADLVDRQDSIHRVLDLHAPAEKYLQEQRGMVKVNGENDLPTRLPLPIPLIHGPVDDDDSGDFSWKLNDEDEFRFW